MFSVQIGFGKLSDPGSMGSKHDTRMWHDYEACSMNRRERQLLRKSCFFFHLRTVIKEKMIQAFAFTTEMHYQEWLCEEMHWLQTQLFLTVVYCDVVDELMWKL